MKGQCVRLTVGPNVREKHCVPWLPSKSDVETRKDGGTPFEIIVEVSHDGTDALAVSGKIFPLSFDIGVEKIEMRDVLLPNFVTDHARCLMTFDRDAQ